MICTLIYFHLPTTYNPDVYGPKRETYILLIFEVCIKSALAFRSRSRQFHWRLSVPIYVCQFYINGSTTTQCHHSLKLRAHADILTVNRLMPMKAGCNESTILATTCHVISYACQFIAARFTTAFETKFVVIFDCMQYTRVQLPQRGLQGRLVMFGIPRYYIQYCCGAQHPLLLLFSLVLKSVLKSLRSKVTWLQLMYAFLS